MADELQSGANGQPAPAPNAADQTAAELAQVRAELAQRNAELELSNSVLEQLRPHEELLRDVLADPDFYVESRKAREAFKRSQPPEIPENLRPLADDLKEVKGYVGELKTREKTAKEVEETRRRQQAEAWQKSAVEFIREENKRKPGYLTGKMLANGEDELTDDGLMMVQAVAGYANKHGLSFADAYKRVGDRFAPPGGSKTPPASLPVDAGDIGIPGPSKAPQDEENLDFATRFERAMGITNA